MFMPCEALEGEKYVLTILDDFSRYSEAVGIKRKLDTTDEVVSVLTRWARHSGHSLQRVRTDQGTEYYLLDKYFQQQGVVHELSATYTPETNGRDERHNRTLIERTRAIMHLHNVLKLVWDYAIQVACKLRNCIPSAGQPQTPYENLFGRKPDISSLKAFVCAASVHILKNKRDKLSNVAESGCESTQEHTIYVT
jgi:transposase InsO family protein